MASWFFPWTCKKQKDTEIAPVSTEALPALSDGETPYTLLVRQGKQYLELSKIAMAKAKENTEGGWNYLAKDDLKFAQTHEEKAVELFKKAVKLRGENEIKDVVAEANIRASEGGYRGK